MKKLELDLPLSSMSCIVDLRQLGYLVRILRNVYLPAENTEKEKVMVAPRSHLQTSPG